jgi:hypothetical protein
MPVINHKMKRALKGGLVVLNFVEIFLLKIKPSLYNIFIIIHNQFYNKSYFFDLYMGLSYITGCLFSNFVFKTLFF